MKLILESWRDASKTILFEGLAAKIRKALKDEGGASGMADLEKHTEATAEEIKATISAMEDVIEHRDGDYILLIPGELRQVTEEGSGLWANIHAKRERGEPPAKKGDPDYPDEESWTAAQAGNRDDDYYELDALDENEEYCPVCRKQGLHERKKRKKNR